MKFGVFFQLPCAPWQNPVERYKETIAQAQLADKLGFSTTWLAELHFISRFSIMPAPLILGAAIAQTTSHIKIGAAVNLVPLHHPVRLAEEIASLDVLSDGRAVFGIGRGSFPLHYDGFRISLDESHQRFQEALSFVIKGWTQEKFSFNGDYYSANELSIVPKPLQKPHPPVYVASNSYETFEIVGQLGHNILVTPFIISNQGVSKGLDSYRQSLKNAGHSTDQANTVVNLPVHVNEKSNSARNDIQPSLLNYLSSLKELNEWTTKHQESPAPSLNKHRWNPSSLTPDDIYSEFSAIGDPDRCLDKLLGFQDAFSNEEVMCWFNIGGLLPAEKVERSMNLFAEKVMPNFP